MPSRASRPRERRAASTESPPYATKTRLRASRVRCSANLCRRIQSSNHHPIIQSRHRSKSFRASPRATLGRRRPSTLEISHRERHRFDVAPRTARRAPRVERAPPCPTPYVRRRMSDVVCPNPRARHAPARAVARPSDPCAAPFAGFRDVDGACVDRAEAATVDGIIGVVSSEFELARRRTVRRRGVGVGAG